MVKVPLVFIMTLSDMPLAALIATYADDIKVSQRIQNPGDVAHLQQELDTI